MGGLFDEVDVDGCAVAHRRGPHDRADRLRDAAALADHPTHVALRDAHFDRGATAALGHVDLDTVGVFDDGLHEVLAHIARCGGGNAVDVGGVVTSIGVRVGV